MKIFTFLFSASLTLASVTAILGGQIVPEGSKTYTTGLRNTLDPKSTFSFCGGALITPTHVLTTASCAELVEVKFVSVGSHYYDRSGDDIQVLSVKKHPNYNSETLTSDFAVLKLAKPSKYKPVKLPASDGSSIRSGMWAFTMGWGYTSASFDAVSSEELRRVDQQVISNDACRKALNETTIEMSLVCAGGEKNKSPCLGDSGGPLIIENAIGDGDDVLIGLITGGVGCGLQNSPALYSRVSSALSWIMAVTN